MTLRNDSSRRLTWGLTGLVVLLAAGLACSIVLWQRAERQMQLAQQRLAQHEYARSLAEAQRALESAGEQSIILGPAEAKALLGLPKTSGPGVPAHVDAGMLIDGAEMNSKRAFEKTEPLERAKGAIQREIIPKAIDEGMILDGLERTP